MATPKRHSIYLIANEKGGVGKTSLAFNLAVLRVRAGKPVLLVDADKQTSSSMWAAIRTEGNYSPALICVQKVGKIGNDLLQLSQNYEVIVDAGGADSQEMRQGIAVADKWILPVRPGQLDLFTMVKMRRLRDEVEERVGRAPKAMVVLNAVHSSTNEAEEARELLADDPNMPVAKCQLVDRVAMRRAVLAGCGLIELTGTNKTEALAEMLALYEEVFEEAFHDAQG